MLHSCASYANGNDNYNTGGGATVNCLGYGLGGSGDKNILVGQSSPIMISNCTIDGEGVVGVDGVVFFAAANSSSMLINNIIYDCDKGVDMNGNKGRVTIAAHNLMNSNTTDYNSEVTPIPDTDVSTAPQFTDEANDDYTLASGSPAIDAGSDASNAP